MKKNLMLMLGLASIVLLAGCGGQNVEDTDAKHSKTDVIVTEDTTEVSAEELAKMHPEWVATSLTLDDLKHIEETLPPLSYYYETYDMDSQSIVNSGSYKVAEWEDPVFIIPEYATMADREVISSGIEDDMIYTMTKLTLQDGTELKVLYVNEPDTLFCRAISVENWRQTTLYSDFVYTADIQ